MNFLKILVADDNNINEKNIAGYIGLTFILIYIIIAIFKSINIEVLNSMLYFVGACFGISAFEKITFKNKL